MLLILGPLVFLVSGFEPQSPGTPFLLFPGLFEACYSAN